MANETEIRVPDLGDFSDVEVIEILVAPGEQVAVEDGLVTLETDKASMEVPSTVAGEVASLAVDVGSTVSTGDVIAVVREAGAATSAAGVDSAPQEPDAAPEPAPGNDAPSAAAPTAETITTIPVPAIGDFDAVDVIEVTVAVGDTVAVDDPLITLETDKASMDVPSTVAGVVVAVHVQEGQQVAEGTPIADVRGGDAAAEASTGEAPARSSRDAHGPAATPARRFAARRGNRTGARHAGRAGRRPHRPPSTRPDSRGRMPARRSVGWRVNWALTLRR